MDMNQAHNFYQMTAQENSEVCVQEASENCLKCGSDLSLRRRRGDYCNACGVRKMRFRHNVEKKVVVMKTEAVSFNSIEQHEEFSNSREKIHGIEDLARSIEETGLQNEPVIWRVPCPEIEMPWGKVTHRNFLIVGFRRVAALNLLRAGAKGKALPYESIPVKIYEGDLQGAMRMNLTENLQRQDLSLYEIGSYLSKIRDETGASYAELAQQIGKTKAWVGEVVRFVSSESPAIADLKTLVREGNVSMWQGLAFSKKAPAEQLKICNRIRSAQRVADSTGSGKDPVAEEMEKLNREKAEKKRKNSVRSKSEIETKLQEYALADTSKLEEKDLVHFYGLIKALEWSLGRNVDWAQAEPSHDEDGAMTFAKKD